MNYMDNIKIPTISRPNENEIPTYFWKYITQVGSNDALEGLNQMYFETLQFLKAMPHEKWDFSYGEGKWSIKEVLTHICDCERIFAYRALGIARGDKTVFPSFDQDLYNPNARANDRSPWSLIEEYKTVRNATYSLFENLPEESLNVVGKMEAGPTTARAIAWVILGHEIHHVKIIKERYL